MAGTFEGFSESSAGERIAALIAIAVGTFMFGFDELVEAADQVVGSLGLEGFAQTGHSRYEPLHLVCEKFLAHDALMGRLSQSRVLICHAGMGLIGDGLRAGCRIVIYPRRGATTANHPANDQTDFAIALAARLNLGLCLAPEALNDVLEAQLESTGPTAAPAKSNIPNLIADFLARTTRP